MHGYMNVKYSVLTALYYMYVSCHNSVAVIT